MKRLALLVLVASVAACGKDGGSRTPNTPTPPPTPTSTRIIELEGDLNFGDVAVGSTSDKAIRIVNRGNAALNVTGLTGPATGFTASWTNGTINAGQWQDVTVRFAPSAIQSYNGTMTVSGNQTSGTNTMPVTARGIMGGPRTQFGTGTHLVGTDIASGRYFSDPSDGCYWERLSGLGGTLSDILANEFVGFNAGQWIVDILGSDRAFKSDADCNTWFRDAPRSGPASGSITPGVWLVGGQVQSGTYRTTAQPGCYWERLRHFQGTLSSIIANDFVSGGGSVLVSISGSDAGFHADDSCGTWTRISSLTSDTQAPRQTDVDIEHNRTLHRQRSGVAIR